jgi:hypothetical protein
MGIAIANGRIIQCPTAGPSGHFKSGESNLLYVMEKRETEEK